MTAKTLLQLAGADLSPPPLSEAAIVVIDAQREYVDGVLPLPDASAALDNVAALLARAREAGAPVFHVQHKGRAGGLFDPATAAFAFADGAQPIAGETVVNKGLPNSFAGTDLQEALEKAGRKRLVLAGFMTHMCVSATARAALDLGYQSTVLSDATATRDLPAIDGGGVVGARDLHRMELAALADRFAIVCRTADILD
jgi:nicotinamidase-related amidase